MPSPNIQNRCVFVADQVALGQSVILDQKVEGRWGCQKAAR
jgi:hypothetical protein